MSKNILYGVRENTTTDNRTDIELEENVSYVPCNQAVIGNIHNYEYIVSQHENYDYVI